MKTVYKCQICGIVFDSQKDALACEAIAEDKIFQIGTLVEFNDWKSKYCHGYFIGIIVNIIMIDLKFHSFEYCVKILGTKLEENENYKKIEPCYEYLKCLPEKISSHIYLNRHVRNRLQDFFLYGGVNCDKAGE